MSSLAGVGAELTNRPIRRAFLFFDKDGSGTISLDELGDVLRVAGMNPTRQEIQDLRAQFDADNNGVINYDEFVHMMKSMKIVPETSKALQKKMETAFSKFDKDGDGFISIHELRDMLMKMANNPISRRRTKMTESDLHDILGPMDINGDGKLDYKEYLLMVGRTTAEIEELLALKNADKLDEAATSAK